MSFSGYSAPTIPANVANIFSGASYADHALRPSPYITVGIATNGDPLDWDAQETDVDWPKIAKTLASNGRVNVRTRNVVEHLEFKIALENAGAALYREPDEPTVQEVAQGQCGITVLKCADGKRLAKRIVWQTDGGYVVEDYDRTATFVPIEYAVSNLNELAEVVDRVRDLSNAAIVRASLTDSARIRCEADPSSKIFRRKRDRENHAAELRDVPRCWMMVDIDSYPLMQGDDLSNNAPPIIDRAIHALLPACFHDARAFWTLSSKAGFAKGLLKCHVWFWLDQATGNDDLRRTMEYHCGKSIDLSLFNAVQLHYTADPIIDGGPSPINVRSGWRNGSHDAVALSIIPKPEKTAKLPRAKAASGIGGNANSVRPTGAFEDIIGDGDGRGGFHAPLLAETMRYALSVRSERRVRDDDGVIAGLIDVVQNAPRSRSSISQYIDPAELQRMIDGAFSIIPEESGGAIPPAIHHRVSCVEARKDLAAAVDGFFDRAAAWSDKYEGDASPTGEQAACIVDVGVGKSHAARHGVASFIEKTRSDPFHNRALWLVPSHKLGTEALDRLSEIGLNAATWRGRGAIDPATGETMCQNLEAVDDAGKLGLEAEEAVCGSLKGAHCPFFETCAYQRQKATVAKADVVVAAHQVMFTRLPSAMGNIGAVVVDESWWQAGLQTDRAISLETIVGDVSVWPVVGDDAGQKALLQSSERLADALAGLPDGAYLARHSLVKAGLTEEACRDAAKLEWKRKPSSLPIRPGMSEARRKVAMTAGAPNALLGRRAALWHIAADLLAGREQETGRVEITTKTSGEGSQRVMMIHTKREIVKQLRGLPTIMLDATGDATILRHWFPDIEVLADIRAEAPNAVVTQIVGGWGKTSLIPGSTDAAENKRREGKISDLRDYVALHAAGDALVVTYKDIEDRFADLPGVTTAHFNAVSGLDQFKDAKALFVIGRPMPGSREVAKMVQALTGKPVDRAAETTQMMQKVEGQGDAAIRVRRYADREMEAVRAAIMDAQVVQSIGRARAVNRTPENPVAIYVASDVALPLPVNHLIDWADARPDVVEAMAARGCVLMSPTDAAKAYPDLFPTEAAAKMALHRAALISVTNPYEGITHREMLLKSSFSSREITYRPAGRGQQTRTAWVRADRVDGFANWIGQATGKEVRVIPQDG